MKTYLVNWPDNTSSVASAKDYADLAYVLDGEGNIDDAEVIPLTGKFHLTSSTVIKPYEF
jgi:hypothetical protein